jgi:hypothetical protein
VKRLAPILLAACGGTHAATDAAPDASTRCSAVFSGNFGETGVSDGCAMLGSADSGDVTLVLMVPSTTLATSFAGTFDLGPAPTPGHYSSRTVTTWRMRAVQRIGDGTCLYAAGDMQVPQGFFDLMLTEVDAAGIHGTLDLTQYILGFPSTDCGDSQTEVLNLSM